MNKSLESERRGWVTIERGNGRQISPRHHEVTFDVYEWDEHQDSGQIVASFAQHHDAVEFAAAWAEKHQRKIRNAEIISIWWG